MRTSLNEIAQLENLLLEQGDVADRLVTEANVLTSSEMAEKAVWQARTYDLIHLYGREKLLEEVRAVEHRLFKTSSYRSFQDRIRSIFNQ